MTGDHRYETILATPEKGKVRNMCDVAERLEQEGIRKGIEQGIQQGIQQGIRQGVEQGIQQGIRQGVEQGVQQGREGLASAIRDLRQGATYEALVEHYGKETADCAMNLQ